MIISFMKKLLRYNALFILLGLFSCKKVIVGYSPYEYVLDSISSCKVGKIYYGSLYEGGYVFSSNDDFYISLQLSFVNVSKIPYHGKIKNFLSKFTDIKISMISMNDTINVDSLFCYRYQEYETAEELEHSPAYQLSNYYCSKDSFLNNYPVQTYNSMLLVLNNKDYFNNGNSVVVKFKIDVSWLPYQNNPYIKNASIYTEYVTFQ